MRIVLAEGVIAMAIVLCTVARATPACADPLQVDVMIRNALQLDVNVVRGGDLYHAHCKRCHGPAAYGDAAHAIPALAGQRQAYLIKQLADFAEVERDGPAMHGILRQAGVSDMQAWADIAAWLNERRALRRPQRGDAENLSLGEAIFQEQCASCHDADARGGDKGFAPALRNQHYSYLLLQMRKLSSSHRRNLDENLVRFLGSLQDDEMQGIADYLSRRRGPTSDRLRMNEDGHVGD